MARRVYLHVGTPKTGTTFLQKVLWSHRQALLDQGMLLPGGQLNDHFRGCLDVYQEDPPGAWQRLVKQVTAWDGDALISHELYSRATTAQADRAIAMLGDTEVHVVVTARDLVRQIPAEWQEHLKHRCTFTLPEFVRAVRDRSADARWFWAVQDIPAVLDRWGHSLPRERVHVVTVPPAGGATDALWHRFTGLLGIDGHAFDLSTGRSNSSLGAEQAELLRQLNARLGSRLPMPEPYLQIVKESLAHEVLAERPGTKFGLVGEYRSFAVQRSAEMVATLRHQGFDVIGDLQDLIPPAEPEVPVSADADVSQQALLEESLEALTGLLERLPRERPLRAAITDAEAERDRLRHAMQYRPIRHLLIGQSMRHRWLRPLHGGYRRIRDLVSQRQSR